MFGSCSSLAHTYELPRSSKVAYSLYPKFRSGLHEKVLFRRHYLPTLKNADIGRLMTGGDPAWRGLTQSISSLLYVFHRKTITGIPLESETVVTLFPECDVGREVETL